MIELTRWKIVGGCVKWFKVKVAHYIPPIVKGLPSLGPCVKAVVIGVPLGAGIGGTAARLFPAGKPAPSYQGPEWSSYGVPPTGFGAPYYGGSGYALNAPSGNGYGGPAGSYGGNDVVGYDRGLQSRPTERGDRVPTDVSSSGGTPTPGPVAELIPPYVPLIPLVPTPPGTPTTPVPPSAVNEPVSWAILGAALLVTLGYRRGNRRK